DPNCEFDIVMNPKGKGGQWGLLQNWSIGLVSQTKVKDAAWEFLKALTGAEPIAYLSGIGRQFPWRKSVAESKTYRDAQPFKNVDVMFRMGEKMGKVVPFVPAWRDIAEIGRA